MQKTCFNILMHKMSKFCMKTLNGGKFPIESPCHKRFFIFDLNIQDDDEFPISVRSGSVWEICISLNMIESIPYFVLDLQVSRSLLVEISHLYIYIYIYIYIYQLLCWAKT